MGIIHLFKGLNGPSWRLLIDDLDRQSSTPSLAEQMGSNEVAHTLQTERVSVE